MRIPIAVVGMLLAQNPEKTADIGGAFQSIAKMLVGYLPGFLTLIFVLAGFLYAGSIDDPQKATMAKRAIQSAVIGGIIAQLAMTFVPGFLKLFS